MSAIKPSSQTEAVFLVGPMGVGKSTLGPLLATNLGLPFLDTDHEIERREGRTIPEIFDQDGEARFRELEVEAIAIASATPAVIALGGGAIAQPGAVPRLESLGIIVNLEADVETLLLRIGDPSTRPLLAGLDPAGQRAKLEKLLEERAKFYASARFSVDASGPPEKTVQSIVKALASEDSEGALRRSIEPNGDDKV